MLSVNVTGNVQARCSVSTATTETGAFSGTLALMIALGIDSRIGSLGPRWWMKLRAPLSMTLGVTAMLIALV